MQYLLGAMAATPFVDFELIEVTHPRLLVRESLRQLRQIVQIEFQSGPTAIGSPDLYANRVNAIGRHVLEHSGRVATDLPDADDRTRVGVVKVKDDRSLEGCAVRAANDGAEMKSALVDVEQDDFDAAPITLAATAPTIFLGVVEMADRTWGRRSHCCGGSRHALTWAW